jgi:hypothetical protein
VYQIDIAEEPELLRFSVTGEQSLEADAAIDAEIADACMQREATAVLIDIRGLHKRLSLAENHMAARGFRQRMPPSVKRIAIVDHRDHASGSEMYELTAQNRGVDVRFFTNVAEARGWLQLPPG